MKTGYDDFFRKAKTNAGAGNSLSTSELRKFRLNTSSERGETLTNQMRLSAAAKDRRQPKRSTGSEQAERLRQTMTSNRKSKKRRPFPIRLVVVTMLGLMLTGVGLFHHEELDKLLSNVELSAMGVAQAEGAKPAVAPSGARTPAAVSAADAAKAKQPNEWTEEEINHLQKLVQRKEQLDVREAELARLEAELQGQKDELEKKLKSLDDTRSGISTMLQERTTQDEAKVETLVQVYSNMKAQQAAKVLETLDEDLAVEIIGRMKKKNAAEVLNLMKPEKAQSFSEKFAGYRKR